MTMIVKKELAILTFSDNGCGISEDDLPKIFDRFFTSRSDNPSNARGLGLYIVNYIIREHYGELSVVSKEGVGTTFTINFKTC